MNKSQPKPVWIFAACDSRPSEQIYGDPELIHTMGMITFPNETHVGEFIQNVEKKLYEKLGKPSCLSHWKSYRNTERGKKKKAAVFESIIDSVAKDRSVTMWAIMENEKSIIKNQKLYIKNFSLEPFIKISKGDYTFGPFNLKLEQKGLKKSKTTTAIVKENQGAAIVWGVVTVLKIFNTLAREFSHRFSGRSIMLDLRYDQWPNDDIKTLDRLSCFMGLLISGSNGRISPVVNVDKKDHPSDILADNVAGLFSEWDELIKQNGLPENPSVSYGQNEGVFHFYVGDSSGHP